jgi:hypothetical protein
MGARGDRIAVLVALGVLMAAGSVAAQGSGAGSAAGSVPAAKTVAEPVVVSPVQGSEAARERHGQRVAGAVRRALWARGYEETGSQELLGQAVVACQTPECVEQALDAASAAFAIVPAIWSRLSGGEELTLTLVQRSGRNLNASGVLGGELSATTAGLVDELLEQQAAAMAVLASAAAAVALPGPDEAGPTEPNHPHAWKAGPAILIAGGAAAVVAVGVAAGIRTDTQQINTAAAAAWSAIGAAAIAGGVAWWVVGEKRRRKKTQPAGARTPTMALHPTGIDLRLRF